MSYEEYDKNFANYYDQINSGKNYVHEAEVVDILVKKHLHGKRSLSIADVGCGTGGHAIELAKMGYVVKGFDLSKSMIEQAQKKSDAVPFYCMAIKEVSERFDVIISLFDVVNALGDYSSLIEFLKDIQLHLYRHSIFVFDAWNGMAVMRTPPEAKTKVIEKSERRIIRRVIPEVDWQEQKCQLKYQLEIYAHGEFEEHFESSLTINFFTYQEMVRALEYSGMRVLESFPNKEVSKPLTVDDWKVNFVCRKK